MSRNSQTFKGPPAASTEPSDPNGVSPSDTPDNTDDVSSDVTPLCAKSPLLKLAQDAMRELGSLPVVVVVTSLCILMRLRRALIGCRVSPALEVRSN